MMVISERREPQSDDGILYLTGELGDGDAERTYRQVIDYNREGKLDRIQLVINSPGEFVEAGFAIIDIMEWSRIPVHTTGIGRIASVALLIFMAGAPGRRILTQRTTVLSHRFSGIVWGNHSQLIARRKEQDLLHERIVEHYLEYSNIKTREELERDLLRDVDTWLSAEEAVHCGLADAIKTGRLQGKQATGA